MESTYWLKQTQEKPLFPELLWSRPENKRSAGKLLIVGGNSHEFADLSNAYKTAIDAGVGSSRVLVPDSLRKTLERTLPDLDFLPSTKSGNFAQSGLSELLEHTEWAESVLFPGELGRNSETSILLEKFFNKTSIQAVLAKDAVDAVLKLPFYSESNNNIVLIVTIAQLQTLAKQLHHATAVTYGMNAMQLTDVLHKLSKKHKVKIVVSHSGNIFVAVGGKVSSTPVKTGIDDKWRVATGARTAVWWMQNPSKPFEALTTSVLDIQ